MSGAVRSAARSFAAASRSASSQPQASCRAAIAAGSVSGAASQARQQPSARRRQRPLHRAEQRVQRPAVARAVDFQAGARRGIHGQQPGAALRHRAGEARQRACLGGAHIVERHQRGDRLGIGEAAERVEAGDAECLGQAPARHQRRGGAASGARWSSQSPSGKPGRREDLRRLQPAEQGGQVGRRSAAVSNRPVETSSQAAPMSSRSCCARASSRLARAGFQQRFLGDRAGGDQADHFAADRRLAGPGLRVLHLLGDGDAEAAADQAREVGFGRMLRHAAHRDRRAVVLAALGQRDVERGGGGFRVGEEQLVEVAHAEEHQRIRMRLLGGEPLRHGRRGAGGVQRCGRTRPSTWFSLRAHDSESRRVAM